MIRARCAVRVLVNGERRELAPSTTVAEVVATMSANGTGVAVAVNDSVVPRGAWETTALDDGDRIEILTAVQGG